MSKIKLQAGQQNNPRTKWNLFDRKLLFFFFLRKLLQEGINTMLRGTTAQPKLPILTVDSHL